MCLFLDGRTNWMMGMSSVGWRSSSRQLRPLVLDARPGNGRTCGFPFSVLMMILLNVSTHVTWSARAQRPRAPEVALTELELIRALLERRAEILARVEHVLLVRDEREGEPALPGGAAAVLVHPEVSATWNPNAELAGRRCGEGRLGGGDRGCGELAATSGESTSSSREREGRASDDGRARSEPSIPTGGCVPNRARWADRKSVV